VFYPIVNLATGIIANFKPYGFHIGYIVIGFCVYIWRLVVLWHMVGVLYTLTSPAMAVLPFLLYGSLGLWLYANREHVRVLK
jgi:hypothetical protein